MDSSRYELKYWVAPEQVATLKRQLAPFTRVDPFAQQSEGNGPGYWVRSLYFDTMSLAAYQDKLDGIQHRRKLRLRAYGQTNEIQNVYLEVKEKFGPIVRKHRALLTAQHLEQPPEQGWIPRLRHQTLNTIAGHHDSLKRSLHTPNLCPAVLVVYHRVPYIGRGGEPLRVTFDHSISARRAVHLESTDDGHRLRPTCHNGVVMEVKFSAAMPVWLQSFITRNALIRESISKYTVGMEAVSPFTENRRHQAFVDEGLDDMSMFMLGHTPHTRGRS